MQQLQQQAPLGGMGGDESPPLEDEGEADDDGSHAAIEQMSER